MKKFMKSAFLLLSWLLMDNALAFVSTPHRGVTSSGTALCSAKARVNYQKKLEVEDVGEKFLNRGFEAFDKEEFDATRKFLIDEGEAAEVETLSDVIKNQLLGSSMIYTFAKVREFVRNNRDKYNWYRPELILTEQKSQGGEHATVNFDSGNTGYSGLSTTYERYLKYPITADAIYKFISNKNNKEILSTKIDHSFFDVDQRDNFNVFTTLKRLSDFDGDIVEFDDQFSHTELVYGLTVNRSNKRITVCFRGSVTGGRDWTTNFNMSLKSINTPQVLKDMGVQTNIKVHKGFDEYLFGKDGIGEVKFDDILGQIRKVYGHAKYADYDLYICGHSLGAALTSLLAFYLTASGKLQDVLKGRPITAISFASPQVGDNGYNEAFQVMESKGDLVHIRISNQDDVVPVSPPAFLGGYSQTGVNLHLHGSKNMEIGYRNLKRFTSQLGLRPLHHHSLKTYYERLQRDANRKTLDNFETFAELYDKYTENFSQKNE